MAMWPMRRFAALGAVLFVVLNVVGFTIAGRAPHFGASGASITAWITDHHKSLVIATLLIWVAVVVLVGVLGQIVHLVRDAGHADGASALGIAAGAAVAMLTIGMAMFGVLTQLAVNGTDPSIVRAMYETAQFTLTGLNWVTLALVVALSRAALHGVFPRWSLGLNGIIAVGLVLGGISVRGSGAFAAGTGIFGMISFVVTMVLFLEIAALLWRAAPAPARAHVAAPTPA